MDHRAGANCAGAGGSGKELLGTLHVSLRQAATPPAAGATHLACTRVSRLSILHSLGADARLTVCGGARTRARQRERGARTHTDEPAVCRRQEKKHSGVTGGEGVSVQVMS